MKANTRVAWAPPRLETHATYSYREIRCLPQEWFYGCGTPLANRPSQAAHISSIREFPRRVLHLESTIGTTLPLNVSTRGGDAPQHPPGTQLTVPSGSARASTFEA